MERVLRPVEYAAKSLFFDCRMCGQCAPSPTGMAWPTRCAKQMRNAPLGGVRADGNGEVIADMRCVWLEATRGIAAINRPEDAGRRVCIEMIRALRGIEGVAGVPLMGYRNASVLAQIIVESGARQPGGRLQAPVGKTG